MLLGTRDAVEVEAVAEEIRDLNTYRRYSAYQTEGEVAAKIVVPDNHIAECRKWRWDKAAGTFALDWVQANPRFTSPDTLSNVRELI